MLRTGFCEHWSACLCLFQPSLVEVSRRRGPPMRAFVTTLPSMDWRPTTVTSWWRMPQGIPCGGLQKYLMPSSQTVSVHYEPFEKLKYQLFIILIQKHFKLGLIFFLKFILLSFSKIDIKMFCTCWYLLWKNIFLLAPYGIREGAKKVGKEEELVLLTPDQWVFYDMTWWTRTQILYISDDIPAVFFLLWLISYSIMSLMLDHYIWFSVYTEVWSLSEMETPNLSWLKIYSITTSFTSITIIRQFS